MGRRGGGGGGYVCVSGFVLLLLVTFDCLVLAGVDRLSTALR